MRTIRNVAFLAMVVVLAFGSSQITAASSATTDACQDIYPSFCFDNGDPVGNEPGWCEDPGCGGQYRGFVADCVPAYVGPPEVACEDQNPDFCDDMLTICTQICWHNAPDPWGPYATGIASFSCDQAINCEATCECGVCYNR